jgi:tetratricopeptide (TPR) repeat protein
MQEYLKQAIALDPKWAEPHSVLGLHLATAVPRVSEMISLARAEACKALELLPSEAVAHAVLGAIAAVHDYDWKEAQEEFKLARSSESVSASVHHMYAASYLSPLGRFEEALEEMERVIAQDPLNMLYRGRLQLVLLFAEKYERAIAEAQIVVEFDEKHIAAHSLIALAHFFQGNLAEARKSAEEAFRRTPLNRLAVALQAGLLKQSGEDDQAQKLLATLSEMGPLGMIIYHVVRSDIDAALDMYEQAVEQRHPIEAGLASAGFFRPLRASPRWPKLARMMNLPETG